MNILLVEDDYGVRDMLTLLLEEEDHVVQTAIHGQAALLLLEAATALPDVILLDLSMPVMDGAEFRAVQRADPHFRDIPVIVLSADRSIAQKAAAMAVAAYLPKPISLDDLLPMLERFVA